MAGVGAVRVKHVTAIGGAIVDVVVLSPFRIERFYAQYEHSPRFMLQ